MVSRAASKLAALAALAIGAALTAPACAPSEAGTIRVAVSTDAPTPVTFDELSISVRRTNTTIFLKDYDFDAVTKLPDSLVLFEKDLLQDQSRTDPISVIVTAMKGKKPVITRSAVVQFGERSVLLRMPLCKACSGTVCAEGQTCKAGKCAASAADEATLPDDAAEIALTDPECPHPAPSCAGACGTPDCGACPAASSVPVAVGGASFSIDATEVTRAAYAGWLATNPHPPESGDQDCSLATAFYPDSDCLARKEVCQGSECEQHPQVCVKWCAAQAYCAWAGKRLCGGVGGKHLKYGPLDAQHEWALACGGPSSLPVPYGTAPKDGVCNVAGTSTTPVKSLSTCEGGVPGLFDMSGNVGEWENACQGSVCAIVGGGYGSTATGSTCSTWFSDERAKPLPNVGIRCCDDP